MKHGSLFSGIGGFDLAAQKMGWENVFHCEWNPFGQKILKHYWPNAISYEDITKTDFTIHRGEIDILTGGFPCQPYSQAGKRKGKEEERHLWPEMLRAIREIHPRFVVGENVSGLINWNGGMVFDEVQSDLEAEGYEVTPFLLPAASVNAPHKRERVWFIAYSENSGCGRGKNKQCQIRERELLQGKRERSEMGDKAEGCGGKWITPNSPSNRRTGERAGPQEEIREPGSGYSWNMEGRSEGLCGDGYASDTNCSRCERRQSSRQPIQSDSGIKRISKEGITSDSQPGRLQNGQLVCSGVSDSNQRGKDSTSNKSTPPECISTDTNGLGLRGQSDRTGESGFIGQNEQGNYWQDFPTESPVCNGDDGLSSRLDGITFSKWRNESIKGGGNAIVHQVALQIFKAIEQFEKI